MSVFESWPAYAELIASVSVLPEDFERRLGIRFREDCDDLDLFKGAVLSTPEGIEFALVHYPRAPGPPMTNILHRVHNGAYGESLEKILAYLAVEGEQVIWTMDRSDFEELQRRMQAHIASGWRPEESPHGG